MKQNISCLLICLSTLSNKFPTTKDMAQIIFLFRVTWQQEGKSNL